MENIVSVSVSYLRPTERQDRKEIIHRSQTIDTNLNATSITRPRYRADIVKQEVHVARDSVRSASR
ncbi:hypothetical protein COLO4_22945 [Corchorus olitorius]|uniref:Uncharacterized protein n=1 Tax=Corchorus olitorius TaxID=93759 RepID=A0A1R3IIW4_9ROSI|nr:hypothetical protein COLO4_22945 [Corchorus olitorius]